MVEIKGTQVAGVAKDRRQVVVTFNPARPEYWGVSGCTDNAGHFVKDGGPLTLADKSSSVCRVDEQTGRAMQSALKDTRGYRVTPTTLELLDGKGSLLAKLVR